MGPDDTCTRSGLLAGEEASANGPAPFEQVANKMEKPCNLAPQQEHAGKLRPMHVPINKGFVYVLCFNTFLLSGTTKSCIFPVSALGAVISPRSLGPFTGEQYL